MIYLVTPWSKLNNSYVIEMYCSGGKNPFHFLFWMYSSWFMVVIGSKKSWDGQQIDQDIIFFVMEASYISTSSSHCEHFITPSLHYVGMSVLKSLPRTIWMLDMNSLFRGLGYRAKQLLFFFFFSPRVKFSYVEPNGKMNLNQSWIHSGLQTEVTRGHFWSSKVALIIHPWH